MIDENLLSPCGLYCGVCGIRTAYLSGNPEFMAAIAKGYGVSQKEIKCDGCLSDNTFVYCSACPIKNCTKEKGVEGCHLCNEWPCTIIEQFPFENARPEMKRAVPVWRQVGTEAWIEQEKKRFSCKNCGTQLFRGARRCRSCGADWSALAK